ncbi:Uncharacterised protein [Mycobacterium tuberculosis]|nr:Uncharacterised protein [Mycobacterium tuberculosis]
MGNGLFDTGDDALDLLGSKLVGLPLQCLDLLLNLRVAFLSHGYT